MLRIVLSFVAINTILAYFFSSGLELRYSKDNKLFCEFVESSKITKLWFQPYILAPYMVQ